MSSVWSVLCKSLFRRRHSSVIKAPSRWKWWMRRTPVKLGTFKTFLPCLCSPWQHRFLWCPFCKLEYIRARTHFISLDKLNSPDPSVQVLFSICVNYAVNSRARVCHVLNGGAGGCVRLNALVLVWHIHQPKVRALQGATHSHLQLTGLELAQWAEQGPAWSHPVTGPCVIIKSSWIIQKQETAGVQPGRERTKKNKNNNNSELLH